jgi:hypothetical protein
VGFCLLGTVVSELFVNINLCEEVIVGLLSDLWGDLVGCLGAAQHRDRSGKHIRGGGRHRFSGNAGFNGRPETEAEVAAFTIKGRCSALLSTRTHSRLF